MKKIVVLLILTIVLVGCNKKEKEECHSISGGGYDIIFDTNGGIEIGSMPVCIACPPDVYENLPIPEKEGYEFEGWYYDKKLTQKVGTDNSLYINPNPEYAEEDCIIGYNDVNLYAKWNKLDK